MHQKKRKKKKNRQTEQKEPEPGEIGAPLHVKQIMFFFKTDMSRVLISNECIL